MEQDETWSTGTWQDDTGCPISIILDTTSDGRRASFCCRTVLRLGSQSLTPRPTMLLTQTWWPWRPPPLSEIMSKNDEDMGNISAKKYLRTAGVSVRWFDATNNKKHVYHLINTPFVSMHADQLRVEQVDVQNKEWFIFSFKIASPCCGDRAPPCDVGQSHSPINLKLLEAGGRGGMMVLVFF